LDISYFDPNPVIEAVQSLPTKQLAVIVLRYYGGLKPHKIGEIMFVSRRTVHRMLLIAEQSLKQLL
jgi:DNA-directed RNA polymerase specialized sigma24 family protein